MIFNCIDGVDRDFSSVRDVAVVKGFDPVFLDSDDSQLRFDNQFGVWDSLKIARTGTRVPGAFFHWSKKYRQENSVSISVYGLINRREYLAVLPSITVDRDDSVIGKMDLLTLTFRWIYRIFQAKEPIKEFSRFEKFGLIGKKIEDFHFNKGYEISHFAEENDILILLDENGDSFGLDATLLGSTTKFYLA